MKRSLSFALAMFFAVILNASAYDVAAIVWPAYQPEPRWKELKIFNHGNGEWQNVYEAVSKFDGHKHPKVPLWGYENEADPIVVARKIDAALAAGVNTFIYDWYWYQSRPFLENALNEGFLKAPNNERMKFYIMWANHDVNHEWDNTKKDKHMEVPYWDARVSYDEFTNVLVPRFIGYFKKPNYYKIDGKPVFMLFRTSTFTDGVGGMQKAKEALNYFREEVKKAGFDGLHLQFVHAHYHQIPSIEGDKKNTVAEVMDYLGADSATIYNWLDIDGLKGGDSIGVDYSEFAKKCVGSFDSLAKKFDRPFVANVTIGWDNNSRYKGKDKINPILKNRTPEAFENALREAKNWTDKNHGKLPKLIIINAWNEWTEDGYLEPDTEFGYGYLNACARVFGPAGQSKD